MPAVCGLDWASDHHDICIQDPAGTVLVERRFTHDEQGLNELLSCLAQHEVARVAIERPDGLLVGRLVDAGHVVLPVHPNQAAAARDRFRAAGSKDDRFDAQVLCELARTDSHRFPALAVSDDHTRAVQALSRTRDDLVAARVRLANQLRAELDRFWPGAACVFADIDSPIALAFLARYPSPHDARALGPRRMQAFLDRHRYCGRRTAAELITRLNAAPTAVLGELEADARRSIVLGHVAALEPIVEQIRQLTSQLRGTLDQHPDGALFAGLFKDPKSAVTAAGLLAEIGSNRNRYPTADALCAAAGVTPVTRQSGKKRTVGFRWACDHRLRRHFATLADSTRHHHPWAHDTYQRARARGCDHPHAIRILGRAWARVIWRCWTDHTTYDPTRHRAATRLNQEGG